jgi:DNA-directed RNA polymerase specialized sigma24 family protein
VGRAWFHASHLPLWRRSGVPKEAPAEHDGLPIAREASTASAAGRSKEKRWLLPDSPKPMLNRMSIGPSTCAQPENLSPARVADVLVANYRQFASFLENEVGSRAVSEEILQDAFGRGAHNLGAFHAHESAVAWFYRLLRNAVIEQPRAGSSEHKLTAFRTGIEQRPEPSLELLDAIRRYVAELTNILEPEHAAALRSVELGGTSIDDFAAAAGISPRLALVRVSDARAALRRRVVSSCGICAVHGRWNCTCGSGFMGYGQAQPLAPRGE